MRYALKHMRFALEQIEQNPDKYQDKQEIFEVAMVATNLAMRAKELSSGYIRNERENFDFLEKAKL